MTLRAIDDARLLAATTEDPTAFATFYERYERTILVYLLRRVPTGALAVDLTAESFAAALLTAGSFRFEGAPPVAWLFRITRNVLFDSAADGTVSSEARRRLELDALVLSPLTTKRLRTIGAQARSGHAGGLLAHLPAEHRAVVIAHILDDEQDAGIGHGVGASGSVVAGTASEPADETAPVVLRGLRDQLAAAAPLTAIRRQRRGPWSRLRRRRE